MKYIVVLGDGMADYPMAELGNRTPLQAARKPSIDYLATHGVSGMVSTIPDGFEPGSDVANLSVIGYDPKLYYTGRSPLEAVGMGIPLDETDVAVRCNLVTLSDEADYREKWMLDYSADEISTEEAGLLIRDLQQKLGNELVTFHPGVSYRHCMVWKKGSVGLRLTPPHDISDRKITDFLPENRILRDLMAESFAFLQNHPVNAERVKKGLKPANSIWLWGEGTRLTIPSFEEKYGLNGSVISAVDLLKGIAISAGLDPVFVPGATGNIHTDFTGKKDAAIRELKDGKDFVYIHVEAPDECGHRHEIDNKVRAIELIDEKIVTPLLEEIQQFDRCRILVLPDHPTPLSLRTHTAEPVPFILYDSLWGDTVREKSVRGYDEEQAKETGISFDEGCGLMDWFIHAKDLDGIS